MNTIITGTSRGIGQALVKKFINSGSENDKIFALSRKVDNLLNSKLENSKLYTIECDISNPKQVDNALHIIRDNCNSIDFLVNNAGLILNKPFLEIKSSDIDSVFDTNFKAPFLLIQKLLPMLAKANSAHIVNITSMGGFQGAAKFPGLSVYSSSKAAFNCLTECLAEELKSTSIKINALCLGAVETEMLSAAFPNYKAPINSTEMAEYIFHFTCFNHRYFNGKLIPVALSTP